MRTIILGSALFSLCILVSNAAMAQNAIPCDTVAGNLVQNCGFETGDFTYWTQQGDNFGMHVDSANMATGNNAAFISSVIQDSGSISQTLATTSGQTYNISLAIQIADQTVNQVRVYWDGAAVFDAANMPDTAGAFTQINIGPVTASTSGTQLAISCYNPNGNCMFDDVVVQ